MVFKYKTMGELKMNITDEFPKGAFETGYYDECHPKEKWTPKVGEWVVYGGFKSIYKIKVIHNNWMFPYELEDFTSVELKRIRPAELNDWAVEIPGYGKVWIKDYGDFYILQGNENISDGYQKSSPKQMWIVSALVKTYDISVIPKAEWERLNKEVKDDTI
jgi:hypothetical protein